MTKNFTGGSKHKKFKKGNGRSKNNTNIEKYPGTEYGYITKKLGDGRFTVFCYDKKQRLAIIRGNMRKKVWVNVGDICLLGLREFQDDKCDIMQKFNPDQVTKMLQRKLIDNNFVTQSQSHNNGFSLQNTTQYNDIDDIFDNSMSSTFIMEEEETYSKDKWHIGEVIDVQTGDGIEYNVTIIGYSEKEDHMIVRFNDDEEEDWEMSYFRKREKKSTSKQSSIMTEVNESESQSESESASESASESESESKSIEIQQEINKYKYKKQGKYKQTIHDDENNEDIDIDDL